MVKLSDRHAKLFDANRPYMGYAQVEDSEDAAEFADAARVSDAHKHLVVLIRRLQAAEDEALQRRDRSADERLAYIEAYREIRGWIEHDIKSAGEVLNDTEE